MGSPLFMFTPFDVERENFICKAGTPEGQLPIDAGGYVTVHNNAHIEEKTSIRRGNTYGEERVFGSFTPSFSRGRGPSGPQFGVLPYLCVHGLT